MTRRPFERCTNCGTPLVWAARTLVCPRRGCGPDHVRYTAASDPVASIATPGRARDPFSRSPTEEIKSRARRVLEENRPVWYPRAPVQGRLKGTRKPSKRVHQGSNMEPGHAPPEQQSGSTGEVCDTPHGRTRRDRASVDAPARRAVPAGGGRS